MVKRHFRPNNATFYHQTSWNLNSSFILLKGMTFVLGFTIYQFMPKLCNLEWFWEELIWKSSLKPLYQYNPNHAERFSSSLSKGSYPSSIYVIGRVSCNFVIPTLCHVLDFVCDNDIIFRKRHSFHILLKYLHSWTKTLNVTPKQFCAFFYGKA